MNRLFFTLFIAACSLQHVCATEHEKFNNVGETKLILQKEILEYEEILHELKVENAPERLKEKFEGLKKSYEQLLEEYNKSDKINIEERIASIQKEYNIFYNNAGAYY